MFSKFSSQNDTKNPQNMIVYDLYFLMAFTGLEKNLITRLAVIAVKNGFIFIHHLNSRKLLIKKMLEILFEVRKNMC